MRQTFKTVPSVYLLLFDNQNVLLGKRVNTGYEDGKFGLVAGHVEANESLRSAMVREASEEIGIHTSPDNVELSLVMHRFASTSTPPERLDFFMSIKEWQGQPINMEPGKCEELTWFDLDNLPNEIIPYIRFALEQVRAGNRYCEYGWES
jgi:8-oxo-dGTP pyrophosphatase MutT (NUDIX family)